MDSRRRQRWQPGWGRPLLRTALLFAGGAALASWAVLITLAVFTEPGGGDASGTLLAVAMIGSWIVAGTVVTVMITNPGWVTGVAGGVTAVLAAGCGWLVYTTLPEPGVHAFIAHRQAMSALAFGFGVLGGGLLVLGETATDGKVLAARWRPPSGLTVRVAILGTAAMLLAAGTAAPAMQEWTDEANTDAVSTAEAPPPPADLTLEHAGVTTAAWHTLGTPSGLLAMEGDVGSPMAVSMHDVGEGDERWHYRRWNREFDGEAVASGDGSLVAIPGAARGDGVQRHVTVLESDTGALAADFAVDGDVGAVVAMTDSRVVHRSGTRDQLLTAFDFSGEQAWSFEAPPNCSVSTLESADSAIVAGMSCLSEARTEDTAQVVVLDSDTGRQQWSWEGQAQGVVGENGIAVAPDRVIVDVRSDETPNDGLFAARQIRHDVNALALDDGEELWRLEDLDLGDTYASACAGTLGLAGLSADDYADETIGDEAWLLLGECHQTAGAAGGDFDVDFYSLEDGSQEHAASAPLGFAPTREEDASGWFVGLDDGRAVIAADASMDVNTPECRLHAVGPDVDSEELPVPDDVADTDWCRAASLHVTPNSLAVGYQVEGEESGGYFGVR